MVSIEKNKRNVSGFKTEEHQKNCEKVSEYCGDLCCLLITKPFMLSADNLCNCKQFWKQIRTDCQS